MRVTTCVLLACLSWPVGNAVAQTEEKDPAAILEIGGAASWAVKGGGSSFGPTVAVEVTPLKDRLELEAGVTPLLGRHSQEWDTDLLFKKPWTLSKKLEFMIGAGPEWIHAKKLGLTSNSLSVEGGLDFMWWPFAKRRFGWYLEPAYEYNFARGREQSLGVTAGLLIAIP